MAFVAPATVRGRNQRQSSYRRNLADYTPEELVENIREVYASARLHGARSWYGEAHEQAKAYAELSGITVRTMIGIIAALSPSTGWERNLSLALTLAETGDCAHAYGDCIEKARKIRNGADPYDVLGGRKVRSFFRNLLHPYRPGAVTIDRHAFSIALLGLPKGDTDRRSHTVPDHQLKALDRAGVYQLFAGAYRAAARLEGLDPHDLQSITWDYWRDVHAYHTTANYHGESF